MAKQANTLSLGTDNIGSLLWRYAAPAIIAMASNSIYHIVDSVFVGHGVGGAAISGMAITMPIMNIAAAFGAMVGVGAAARMSIRLGEGNMQAAERTLANAVMHYFKDEPFTFRAITPLDRDTSGVVLLAKNIVSADRLSKSLIKNEIEKEYVALSVGTPSPKTGRISAPPARQAGR